MVYKDMTEEEVIIEVVNTWHEFLKDCDARRVFDKLNKHIATNRFPPTIAEIRATKPPENEFLKKYEQWEREAKNAKHKLGHSS